MHHFQCSLWKAVKGPHLWKSPQTTHSKHNIDLLVLSYLFAEYVILKIEGKFIALQSGNPPCGSRRQGIRNLETAHCDGNSFRHSPISKTLVDFPNRDSPVVS